MKEERDILRKYNILNDLGYRGRGDKSSKGRTFFTITHPELVEKNQNRTFDEITDSSDDLQGEELKFIILSNIIHI